MICKRGAFSMTKFANLKGNDRTAFAPPFNYILLKRQRLDGAALREFKAPKLEA